MIEIVSATRLSETEFWTKTALGLSLQRLKQDGRMAVYLAYANRSGLPEVYNSRIRAANEHDYLLFVHDDVWLDDFFLVDRLIEGLRIYDVLGVAGNRRRVSNQPAWAFIDDNFTWDSGQNLTGRIAHGPKPFGDVSHFGEVPAECELLDGVLLASRKSTLTAKGVFFDPRFDFHFYDMDFCRTARKSGLRLGTWPICITHQSGGPFGTESWAEGYRRYIDKWKE